MSDLENIDDELLSAYLDDELSPAEHARVEARLATDPAARQLLEQLRVMSQAVHSLPQESLGREFRDAIVRRAEQASAARTSTKQASTKQASQAAKLAGSSAASSPAPPNGAAKELRSAGPSFTLGRSRRGWVWAAMAVAAGLLIMVFQPVTDKNRDVALRDVIKTDEAAQVATEALKQRTMAGQAAPASPGSATAPFSDSEIKLLAESERLSDSANASINGNPASPPALERELADRSATASAEPSGAVELGMAKESDRFAATDKSATPLSYGMATSSPTDGIAGEGPNNAPQMAADAESKITSADDNGSNLGAGSFARRSQELETDDGQFIIVRVIAKPEALQNKAFDKILGTNGVEVIQSSTDGMEQLASQKETQPASREPRAAGEKAAESADLDATDIISAAGRIASRADRTAAESYYSGGDSGQDGSGAGWTD